MTPWSTRPRRRRVQRHPPVGPPRSHRAGPLRCCLQSRPHRSFRSRRQPQSCRSPRQPQSCRSPRQPQSCRFPRQPQSRRRQHPPRWCRCPRPHPRPACRCRPRARRLHRPRSSHCPRSCHSLRSCPCRRSSGYSARPFGPGRAQIGALHHLSPVLFVTFAKDLVDILKNRASVAKYRFAATQSKEQDKQRVGEGLDRRAITAIDAPGMIQHTRRLSGRGGVHAGCLGKGAYSAPAVPCPRTNRRPSGQHLETSAWPGDRSGRIWQEHPAGKIRSFSRRTGCLVPGRNLGQQGDRTLEPPGDRFSRSPR